MFQSGDPKPDGGRKYPDMSGSPDRHNTNRLHVKKGHQLRLGELLLLDHIISPCNTAQPCLTNSLLSESFHRPQAGCCDWFVAGFGRRGLGDLGQKWNCGDISTSSRVALAPE